MLKLFHISCTVDTESEYNPHELILKHIVATTLEEAKNLFKDVYIDNGKIVHIGGYEVKLEGYKIVEE